MNQVFKIEIPVEAATAAALLEPRRLEAVGRLVDRLVQPGIDDPLIALFQETSAEAKKIGLTEEDINMELAAYKAERRG